MYSNCEVLLVCAHAKDYGEHRVFKKYDYHSLIFSFMQFPKLSTEYFKLVTFVCDCYPEKIEQLPEDLFGTLIASLEMALSQYPFILKCYIKTVTTEHQLWGKCGTTVAQLPGIFQVLLLAAGDFSFFLKFYSYTNKIHLQMCANQTDKQ